MLRDVEIYINRSDFQNMGINNSDSVTDLFLRKLKRNRWEIQKVNIHLRNCSETKLEFLAADTVAIYCFFDFLAFRALTNEDLKRKQILDIILKALIECGNSLNFEVDSILDSYNSCINVSVLNESIFKNKRFKSPNGLFYVEACVHYDLYFYCIYLRLYNKKKRLIGTSLVFKDRFKSFEIESINWEYDSKLIYYKFKTTQKIFNIKLEELAASINQVGGEINTSDFFKPLYKD